MDLSKLFSPHKAQPDGGTPPAVDPSLEPVTLAMPRMAAGMARSNPAGTGTHPAGLAAGATQTHLAGPPASHTTQVGSDALFAAAADSEQMTTAGMQAGQPSSGNLQVSFADAQVHHLVDADPNDFDHDHNDDPFESAPDSNDPTTTNTTKTTKTIDSIFGKLLSALAPENDDKDLEGIVLAVVTDVFAKCDSPAGAQPAKQARVSEDQPDVIVY